MATELPVTRRHGAAGKNCPAKTFFPDAWEVVVPEKSLGDGAFALSGNDFSETAKASCAASVGGFLHLRLHFRISVLLGRRNRTKAVKTKMMGIGLMDHKEE